MKKPDKNKMGRIGKMLVLGTALLSMATPMAAFAKTDRVNTPGTWRKQGEKWQFLRDYSTPEKGWLVYERDWYYQSPVEELMETGWLNLQGKTYFLSTEDNSTLGHVLTGWQWIDGYCYYFEEADQADYGVLFTGGRTKDGYYVDANGRWLNGAGGEPVYISGKGLSAAVSDQQVAGVSRSIPSGNVGQVAGVSRSGGSVSRGGSSSSSGGSTSGSGSSSSSGNSTSGSTSGGNTGNTASSSNLPKEEDGKPEENPTPEQPEEKNVVKLVGEAKVNQDVNLYVSKDIMDSIAFVSIGVQPILPESHRENEPSYSLDREKQILTLPKSLFKESKTYIISIQAGGIQPFHDIKVEVKDDAEVPFTAEKGEPEVLNKGILLGPTYTALNEEADLHAFRLTYVPGKGMPEKPWWTTHLQYVEVNSTLYERVSSEKEFLEKKDVYYIVPEDAETGANTILLSDSAFEDKEKFNLRLESDISIQSINWFMAE